MDRLDVKFGISLPNVGDCGDPATLIRLGLEAEAAGWDAVFVWDCVQVEVGASTKLPTADPWIALAALAAATTRVRIGPIVMPLARRRPWKVARETVTLDLLSQGRLILPVGYGAIDDGAFCKVGEELAARVRADKVDEALEIITGLWSGQPFSYEGDHYRVDEMTFSPAPLQTPRIPIWLDAVWPRKRSMRRAARYDGIIPSMKEEDGGPMTPQHVRDMKEWLEMERGSEPQFDIVHEGGTPGGNLDAAVEEVRPWAEAGVSWWIESVWTHFYRGTLKTMQERITQGPPVRAGA